MGNILMRNQQRIKIDVKTVELLPGERKIDVKYIELLYM